MPEVQGGTGRARIDRGRRGGLWGALRTPPPNVTMRPASATGRAGTRPRSRSAIPTRAASLARTPTKRPTRTARFRAGTSRPRTSAARGAPSSTSRNSSESATSSPARRRRRPATAAASAIPGSSWARRSALLLGRPPRACATRSPLDASRRWPSTPTAERALAAACGWRRPAAASGARTTGGPPAGRGMR